MCVTSKKINGNSVSGPTDKVDSGRVVVENMLRLLSKERHETKYFWALMVIGNGEWPYQ